MPNGTAPLLGSHFSQYGRRLQRQLKYINQVRRDYAALVKAAVPQLIAEGRVNIAERSIPKAGDRLSAMQNHGDRQLRLCELVPKRAAAARRGCIIYAIGLLLITGYAETAYRTPHPGRYLQSRSWAGRCYQPRTCHVIPLPDTPGFSKTGLYSEDHVAFGNWNPTVSFLWGTRQKREVCCKRWKMGYAVSFPAMSRFGRRNVGSVDQSSRAVVG